MVKFSKMVSEAEKYMPRSGTGRMNLPVSKAGAEKLFNRKAHPDASLTPKAFLKKKANDFVMSKGVGKVLDNKVVKKGFVPVGNAIIKGVKSIKPDMRKITDDLFGSKKQDNKYRSQGKALNRQYSGK